MKNEAKSQFLDYSVRQNLVLWESCGKLIELKTEIELHQSFDSNEFKIGNSLFQEAFQFLLQLLRGKV